MTNRQRVWAVAVPLTLITGLIIRLLFGLDATAFFLAAAIGVTMVLESRY